jgi:hypothetical protein
LIFWTVFDWLLGRGYSPCVSGIIAPVRERASLRNLAGAISGRRSALAAVSFAEAFGDIRRISNLLQQFERQISDEGFSLKAILSSMVEGSRDHRPIPTHPVGK